LLELCAAGVQIAIDDFGTGYASLTYLRRFPVDTIKIDRSFIKDVIHDADVDEIVKAIVAMGHSLKLRIVSEGIETPEQLSFAQSIGCDEGQGYLFAKPMPVDEMTALLQKGEPLTHPSDAHACALEAMNETGSLSPIEKTNNAIKVLYKDLAKKNMELERLTQTKSAFLANMSHELRTPLNSILILAQDLAGNRGENLNGEQIESAGIIYSSGKDLLRLINDILDLSKVEAGKIEITLYTVALGDLVRDIDFGFKRLAEDKGLYLHIVLQEGLPETVVTDQFRLTQVLRNVVSNAIKFTSEGGITVTLSRPSDDADLSKSGLSQDACIAISIADTGIGIPESKQQKIFKAFQQVDGGITREFGGTGLGLAISQDLIGLLGGEIQVCSHSGSGALFTLYLPEVLDVHNGDNEEHTPDDD